MKIEEVNYVIVHGSCPDGWGSAYSAWSRIGMKNVEYFFAYHSNDSRPKIEPQVDGKNVVMIDFSYNLEYMNELCKRANSMLVLDHHKSAKQNLEGKLKCEHVFDMDRSGARMAWDWFHPNEFVPELIHCIEDRDLHKWEFKNSKEYLMNFDVLDLDTKNLEKTFGLIHGLTLKLSSQSMRERGKNMLDYQTMLVNNVVNGAKIMNFSYPNGDQLETIKAWVVNCAAKEIISDAGSILANINPEVNVAVIWYGDLEKEKIVVSLRSNDKCDVANIAIGFGGGGHAKASGFSIHKDSINKYISNIR